MQKMKKKTNEEPEIDFKKIKAKVVGYYNKVSKKRFKHLSNGTKIDRWMFQATMFLIFGFLFFVAYSYDFNLDYYKCGSGTPDYVGVSNEDWCDNPFYNSDNAWKGEKVLPPGEYGTKPGPLFNSVIYIPFILFAITGLLNQFIHNRGRRQ